MRVLEEVCPLQIRIEQASDDDYMIFTLQLREDHVVWINKLKALEYEPLNTLLSWEDKSFANLLPDNFNSEGR